MKLALTYLLMLLLVHCTLANVNFIDIKKIGNEDKYVRAFEFLKDNQQYYDHWSNEWTYNKSKEVLIKELKEIYFTFFSLPKNSELSLLLGDISHYLYNLNDSASYKLAVKNYSDAIQSNPQDYRGRWFLGYHYALSNLPNEAFDNFLKAEKLLPAKQPSEFWDNYAWASAVANMPSHSIFAMDKAKSISGGEEDFDLQLGPAIRRRIVKIDKENGYKKEEIWTAIQGQKITFTSRPFGIKILLDSTWKLSITDYEKRQAAFIITPPALHNRNGEKIDYTIGILMKTANEPDALEDYINNFVPKNAIKNKTFFSDKYDKMIAFEIKDKNMYQEIGGGRLYLLGIERTQPKYPGLLLENPMTFPMSQTGKITYYRASDSKDRFTGKIFYAIMLDTCGDINDQSLSIFKTLFNDQIIIE